MRTLFGAVGALFCAILAAVAETVTLTPSADTTLFEYTPNNNLGSASLAGGTIALDFRSRALIKFDVASQIPPGVNVIRARLRVNVVKIPPGGRPSTFTLRRVLKDWAEGDKFGNQGGLASAGETTWNNRFHPATSWETPGGAVDADFSSTVSSSASVSGLGTVLFDSASDMIADVQHWLANPTQNFGWMLISDSEETTSTARRFGSREDAANAPVLEIEYAPVFRIENIAVSDGTFRFSFPVEPLFTYTVQSRGSLSTGSWNPLTNFTETISSYDAAISDAMNAPSRFYRVLKAPCNCQ
jgi:hypothetical protein